VQGNQVRLQLTGTYQLLAYAADVNVLGGNINTIKKKNFDATKEVGVSRSKLVAGSSPESRSK
jgi:hypothetical protein